MSVAMAGKPPNDQGEGSRESFFDQFMRSLEGDREASASLPSSSMAAIDSPYDPLPTIPMSSWQTLMSPSDTSSLVNPALQMGHHDYRPPVPSSYLQRDPLLEFPSWLLEELDQRGGSLLQGQAVSSILGGPALYEGGERPYTSTSYLPPRLLPLSYDDQHRDEQLAEASGSTSFSNYSTAELSTTFVQGVVHLRPGRESYQGVDSRQLLHGELAPRYSGTTAVGPEVAIDEFVHREAFQRGEGQAAGTYGEVGLTQAEELTSSYRSSSRLDSGKGLQYSFQTAAPVPRFERNVISGMQANDARVNWERPTPGHSGQFQESSQIGGDMHSEVPRLGRPSLPLAEHLIAAGGSTVESAGTSLSSDSTNEGDGDDSERKEAPASRGLAGEGASSGKRKTPEPSGEEGDNTAKSEQPEAKKTATTNRPRKKGGAKRLREPRYAIKTRTDVEIMDDGFKWRKYGQKAVKNSPHPRNYYRCTTPQCPVRKRVERSNEDSGLVITTYEGTHTHQTPGFHRSAAGGYFGDRPLGLGGGLYLNPRQNPLRPAGFGQSSSNLLPIPSTGFTLASLQQLRAMQEQQLLQQQHQSSSLERLPQQQMLHPGSSFQQDQGLFRPQQFRGLFPGPAAVGPVKQETFQNFEVHRHHPSYTTPIGVTTSAPYPRRQFQHLGAAAGPEQQLGLAPSAPSGSQFFDRGHMIMRSRVDHPSPSGSPIYSTPTRPFTHLPQQTTPQIRSSSPHHQLADTSTTYTVSTSTSQGLEQQPISIVRSLDQFDDPSIQALIRGGPSSHENPASASGSVQSLNMSTQELQQLDQIRSHRRFLQLQHLQQQQQQLRTRKPPPHGDPEDDRGLM